MGRSHGQVMGVKGGGHRGKVGRSQCWSLDYHSFPEMPLPYELLLALPGGEAPGAPWSRSSVHAQSFLPLPRHSSSASPALLWNDTNTRTYHVPTAFAGPTPPRDLCPGTSSPPPERPWSKVVAVGPPGPATGLQPSSSVQAELGDSGQATQPLWASAFSSVGRERYTPPTTMPVGRPVTCHT